MNEAKIRVRPEIVFDRFIRHCRRFRLIAKPSYPRGVFKFRTIEEAQAARTRQTSIRR